MIECTDLFADVEWACAHVLHNDIVRINVQPTQRNMIFTVHVHINKISNFLEQLRHVQHVSIDTNDSKPF